VIAGRALELSPDQVFGGLDMLTAMRAGKLEFVHSDGVSLDYAQTPDKWDQKIYLV